MTTQTIFQAGNSSVVAIPPQYLAELDWDTGQKVHIDKIDDETITIKKAVVNATPKQSEIEFQKWLGGFMAENAETLDELASR